METKVCSRCKQTLSIECFDKRKNHTLDGYRKDCKKCREIVRKRKAQNKKLNPPTLDNDTIKTCKKCNKSYNISNFYKNYNNPDCLDKYCKQCKNIENNKYRTKDKKNAYTRKSAAKARVKRKQWYEDYKSKFVCKHCGENHIACLQFHHPNKDKDFQISSRIYTISIEKLMAEMDKCIPLCANCHFKLHYEEKIKKELDKSKK